MNRSNSPILPSSPIGEVSFQCQYCQDPICMRPHDAIRSRAGCVRRLPNYPLPGPSEASSASNPMLDPLPALPVEAEDGWTVVGRRRSGTAATAAAGPSRRGPGRLKGCAPGPGRGHRKAQAPSAASSSAVSALPAVSSHDVNVPAVAMPSVSSTPRRPIPYRTVSYVSDSATGALAPYDDGYAANFIRDAIQSAAASHPSAAAAAALMALVSVSAAAAPAVSSAAASSVEVSPVVASPAAASSAAASSAAASPAAASPAAASPAAASPAAACA